MSSKQLSNCFLSLRRPEGFGPTPPSQEFGDTCSRPRIITCTIVRRRITFECLPCGEALEGSAPTSDEARSSALASIEVLPFDAAAAAEFGRIASSLAARGTPFGEFDTLIAAHASAARCTMVTNNVRHFSKVPWLVV